MFARGRSRIVAPTAIARQASWERRTFSSSPSSSPPSTASSSSSPSVSPSSSGPASPPPETLEDQLYYAYDDKNLHLAKILLLRLKGIEVSGDDDPRIAEVTDEDFDYCFAPHGHLIIDPADEKVLKEQQRKDSEHRKEYQRLARLRACEQKWTLAREERATVLRSWQLEQAARRTKQPRTQSRQQDPRLFQLQPQSGSDRLSYTRRPLPSDTDSEDDRPAPISYTIPFTSSARNSSGHRQPTSPLSKSSNASHLSRAAHTVPFTEVLSSMQGPLFPLTNEERARRTQSPVNAKQRSRSRSMGPTKASHSQVRRRKEAELFQSLLASPSSIEDSRRAAKGKSRAIALPRSTSGTCSGCRRSPSSSSSSDSPTTSSVSSSISSRPSSWLSFGGSSSASSITTTPSSTSSRRSSWFKASPSPPSPTRRGSWRSSPSASPPSSLVRRREQDNEGCTCHRGHLTPIHITDSPLYFEAEITIIPTATKPYTTSLESILVARNQRLSRASSPSGVTATLLGNISQSVSSSVTQLMELARGFQHAYVTAAMFSVAASYDGDRWEERQVEYKYDEARGVRVVVRADDGLYASGRRVGCVDAKKVNVAQKARSTRRRLKPGYRASPKDVAAFLNLGSCSCSLSSSESSKTEAGVVGCLESCTVMKSTPTKFINIPLRSARRARPRGPSTVLPKELPYKLHFKPIPQPSRCPFRTHAISEVNALNPDQPPIQDYRPQNPCSSGTVRGIQWRIRSVGNPAHLRLRALQNTLSKDGLPWEGRGRELSMGGGRDRVVGIAYENVGRSKLSRGKTLRS